MTRPRLAVAMLVLGVAQALWPRAGTAWAMGTGPTTIDDVAILAPRSDDVVIVETASRLRSELGAIGVASHLVACTDGVAADARACDEVRSIRVAGAGTMPAPGLGGASGASSKGAPAPAPAPPPSPPPSPRARPTALIALAREDGVVTIEVIERLPNGSRFFRLVYVPARDGGKDPAVLAVRGVELLRDLQMDVENGAAAPPPAAPRSGPTIADLPPESEHQPDPERDTDLDRPPRAIDAERGPWRISLALTGLWGRDRLGSGLLSVVPALGGAWMARPTLAVFLVAAGPFRQDFQTAQGIASSRQELAFVGARAELPWRRFRPFATAGIGVLHVLAEGKTTFQGGGTPISSSVWSPALTGGAGGALRVARLIDVVAQVDTLWSAPSAIITVGADEVVGRAGAPSVLAQLGVWLAFP